MSSYSVKKPITILMGVLIIIVLGIFSVTKLPLTLFPDINLPYMVTVTTYEGASPEQLETEVSSKIESSVSTIGNFKEVYSMSNEHFAISVISFADSTNMDTVVIELREMLNNIEFAEGVGNTKILRISPSMMPVMVVNLFRIYDEQLSDEEILIRNTEWIERDVINDLKSIPGIADVSLSGAADTILQIKLDESKITNYSLTNDDVLNTIDRQNVDGLVGIALDSGEIRMLYLGSKVSLLTDLEQLPITADEDNVIRLKDLIVEDGINYVNANTDTYSKINGKQGIQISFQMQSNASITEVTKAITNRLDEITNNNVIEADYQVLLNQGEYITRSIDSVLMNIIFGGLIAIFVLFLFLKDYKPTVIVGLAIPISVIAAFMLMYFTNISLNVVSMGGLALGIGMLVDNAVVVIENIFRMISEGKSKKEAAIEGTKQVAGAITSSTITTAVVFLPLVFVEGMVSDVFMSMALTIAYSLGASLIIALTMVPSLAAQFLNDKKPSKDGKIMGTIKKWYETSVRYTIKHRILTLIVVFFVFIASIAIVMSKGFIFLPATDEGSISVNIQTDSKVEFSNKAKYADLITDQLLKIEDLETVAVTIGGSGMVDFMSMGTATSDISFTINLKTDRKLSTADNSKKVEEIFNKFDYSLVEGFNENQIIEKSFNSQNSAASFLGAQGIQIKVSGYDLEILETISNKISNIISEVDGVEKVNNGISQGQDNVKITVNKDQAMRLGFTNQDIIDNLGYLYTNLEALNQTTSININIEGVNYNLEIPSNQSIGGIDFNIFGDYYNFLSGVMLFDQSTKIMIDEYVERTGQGIYIINAMLPTYVQGDPIKFVINPFLKIIDNKISMDVISQEPTLLSKAITPLYQDNANSVTSIEKITGFSTINTDGTSRYLTVTGQIENGNNVTIVSEEVTRKVNEYLESEEFTQFGRGYTVEFQGENEEIMNAFSDLLLAAIVAILLVYMVMAIQFQSLKYPLIILGTIPLAFTGGMLALIISNNNLSLVSLMGFIILVGIVVNNGIVIIDYINKLREDGNPLVEAIVEAGKTRLRPIFMTALTTIFALVTMVFDKQEGAELLKPMAITAIGGLLYATILTLVVIPTIYVLFNRKEFKKAKIKDGNN